MLKILCKHNHNHCTRRTTRVFIDVIFISFLSIYEHHLTFKCLSKSTLCKLIYFSSLPFNAEKRYSPNKANHTGGGHRALIRCQPFFLKWSVYRAGGSPTLRLSKRGLHSYTCRLQWPSVRLKSWRFVIIFKNVKLICVYLKTSKSCASKVVFIFFQQQCVTAKLQGTVALLV